MSWAYFEALIIHYLPQGDFSGQEDPAEEQQHGPAHAALPRHDLGPRRPRRGENLGRGIHTGMNLVE